MMTRTTENAKIVGRGPPHPKFFTLPVLLAVALALVIGSLRDPNFWRTANQRGDALFRHHQFAEAAKTYTDPIRIGIAQYRNGDFEDAAKTFARVPGATGAFNQGNAWLMHGQYDTAIDSYDRALHFHAGWQEALDNKALAIARRDKMSVDDKTRQQEQAGAYDPDKIVFDQKGGDQKGQVQDMATQEMSDDALRASWLRRVQTTPGDFLRAKFAYQAAKEGRP